ncbi:MAG: 50S ribosomal protein L11, partial [Candidatus Aenigmarchaeota archaeon]|nr:50S ribosomal protein L11 [Candidatus Aenigmarchaeota archaeon]
MGMKTIETLVDAGKASAGPPLGPALGPMGVNIGDVIAAINDKTKDFSGMKVPVKVIIDEDTKDFKITVGTPPTSQLIKKELGIEKGAHKPGEELIADMKIEQAIKIAKMKQES